MARIDGKDLIGVKFGKLTVTDIDKYEDNKYYYICKCDCGNKVIVLRGNLISGRTKSCGCIKNITANKKCSYCGKTPVYAKGLCKTCYARNNRNGYPEYKVCNKTETETKLRKERAEARRQRVIDGYNPTTDKGKILLSEYKNGKSLADLAIENNMTKQGVKYWLTR